MKLSSPFSAYKGNAPCIFVLYAHEDAGLVYSEPTTLKELGYRIWYDERIDQVNK